MPEQLETVAEAIRAQILALAPDSVAATVQSLPPVALLAIVGGAGLLLLWIVLAALGALFGGGGRRKREQEVERELASRRQQDLPQDRGPDRRAPASDRRSEPMPAPAQGGDIAARHEDLMARGDRQAQGNDFNGALATFKEALDVARQLAFQRPEAPEPQRLVAKALHKVGDASGRLGDGHAARQYHEQALVLLRRVNASNPRDAGIARELAVTLERLGAAAAQAGDRTGARIRAGEGRFHVEHRLHTRAIGQHLTHAHAAEERVEQTHPVMRGRVARQRRRGGRHRAPRVVGLPVPWCAACRGSSDIEVSSRRTPSRPRPGG
jgi:tetratricopeptide (TPR) repeat protein